MKWTFSQFREIVRRLGNCTGCSGKGLWNYSLKSIDASQSHNYKVTGEIICERAEHTSHAVHDYRP